MQTLMLALSETVQCVGQEVWFRLTGTDTKPARVQLHIGGKAQPPHPFLRSAHGRRWYRQGDWLVLAPGIQVCAAGIGRGHAYFYIITHSPLRIERDAFQPEPQESTACNGID